MERPSEVLEGLDPAQRRQLEAGEVVTLSAEGPSGRRDVRALALLDVKPAQAFEVVTDYARYKDFMPYTTVSEVRRREGDTVWFYTELGFPLKRIYYELRCELDREGLTARWTLEQGNLKANDGSWAFDAYGDGRALAAYTLSILPGFPIPGWILQKLTQGSLPQLMDAVRERAAAAT